MGAEGFENQLPRWAVRCGVTIHQAIDGLHVHVSPSVGGAGARIDQPGDGYALGAFATVAGMIRPVIVIAFRAEGFENVVGGVVVIGRFWRSIAIAWRGAFGAVALVS